MPQVVGVRFRYSKTLWFDPGDIQPTLKDQVVVTTDRGTEIGEVTLSVFEAAEEDLPAPLKPVLRVATEEDLAEADQLRERERAALPIFREYIEKNDVDMKPADVEILFGEEKIVFYFSAEERVDFRALVRDLAAHFHTRIDMRQVGVRDEARMIGGLGHCGEVLCCARMGGEFMPVSIKMAKEQGLPLNPTKISGLCGRLMCCLRYEVEAYKDFTKRAPRRGTLVDTPRGSGKIVELDALRETVKLQFRGEEEGEQGENMQVALCRLCCKQQGESDQHSTGRRGCRCSISAEDFAAVEAEAEAARGMTLSATGLGYKTLTSTQGTDSAVDNGEIDKATPTQPQPAPKARRRGGRSRTGERQPATTGEADNAATPPPKRRRRGGRKGQGATTNTGSSAGSAHKQPAPPIPDTRVPRRRRRP